MQSSSDEMILIVPAVAGGDAHEDREGGGEHGLPEAVGAVKKLFGAEAVKVASIEADLKRSMEQVRGMLEDLDRDALDGWELNGVSVSLAVTAGGSIGIATAGVTAGFEISFAPASRPEPSEETS